MSRVKQYIDQDVVSAARGRMHHILDLYDSVAVMFSGGKDSLVCLNLLQQVRLERGETAPLDVIFLDEELLPNSVVDFVDSYRRLPWVRADTLAANDYNPNVVRRQELTLLERSLLETGWVQPVLVTAEGQIIDGFHRWMLSSQPGPVLERWGGKLPVAVLDVPRAQAMLLTVRMNRAKGVHVAARMSDMVRELIDQHGLEPDELGRAIGAPPAEVQLLYQGSVFKQMKLDQVPYSKAWVPRETRPTRERKP